MTTPSPQSEPIPETRRAFLKKTSAVAMGTTLAGGLSLARTAHAAGKGTIRVALVGCGGRGTGAAMQALTAGKDVKLVALADAFRDRLDRARTVLSQRFPDQVDLPNERLFEGLDAYRKAIDCDVDAVLLCTPPGFRPAQFEAAVAAGKHVFMEKPVSVDGPGTRRVLAANQIAKQKGLAVVVGFHMRYEANKQEAVRALRDGIIGKIMFLRAYFNSSGVGVHPRQPGQTEMEYQVRNWYYFNWLSGDHIVEQHVHDLDVCDWIQGAHPVSAQGMGGRQVRIGKDYGEIYDHHAVEYTYADGVKLISFSRHIPGCWDSFAEHVHGTGGTADLIGHGQITITPEGKERMRWRRGPDGHQVEQNDFFAAIRDGKALNDADNGATSSMTSILGRMATYSGQIVTWDEAMNSQQSLSPKELSWESTPLAAPGPDGLYPCAMPGKYKVA